MKLRTLGLLGGLSWHSTLEYYRQINTKVEQTLGNYHSAPLMLASLEFGQIVQWQLKKQWDKAGEHLANKALCLEQSGVEALLICSNTMHKVAPQVSQKTSLPLLHIATAIARELKVRGQGKVTLAGTRYTMKEPFLYQALEKEGIVALPPAPAQAKAINQAIFKRLVSGEVTASDQDLLNQMVHACKSEGRDAVVLACTELAMLINEQTPLDHVLDSTKAHSKMAADFVLNGL